MSTEELREYNQVVLKLFEAGKLDDLAKLYLEWGQKLLTAKKVDEGCFFLTQAYILALEKGMNEADEIHQILKYHKREV